jgi:Sensors of blue-light using FAD
VLTHLVYTSRPRFDVSTTDGCLTLQEIARAAQRFNQANGITGVLLAGPTWLAQVLEGEAADLTALLTRILADKRHTDMVIVEMRRIAERRFGQWAMGVSTRPMPEIPAERLGTISAEEIAATAGIAMA